MCWMLSPSFMSVCAVPPREGWRSEHATVYSTVTGEAKMGAETSTSQSEKDGVKTSKHTRTVPPPHTASTRSSGSGKFITQTIGRSSITPPPPRMRAPSPRSRHTAPGGHNPLQHKPRAHKTGKVTSKQKLPTNNNTDSACKPYLQNRVFLAPLHNPPMPALRPRRRRCFQTPSRWRRRSHHSDQDPCLCQRRPTAADSPEGCPSS